MNTARVEGCSTELFLDELVKTFNEFLKGGDCFPPVLMDADDIGHAVEQDRNVSQHSHVRAG